MGIIEKVKGFVRNAKAEFGKITWPGKQQVWYSTLVVIVVTLLVATYLGVVDMALTGIMSWVIG